MDLPGRWHFEVVTADLMVLYRIKDIIHTSRTDYQAVDILESEAFGRCLVLDGKTQSSQVDEFIYHESLVHPAMLLHPRPESVFIGGGGEGATLREALRHPTLQRAVMLDLDGQVVDLCRQFLPFHQGAFDDPRLVLRHEDARKYLASSGESFDVIVLDLVDPIEEGPSYLLYTREFYSIARKSLKPGGILVTQAGPAGLLNYQECLTAIAHTLSTVFPQTYVYTVYVPAFTTLWGFVIAVNQSLPYPVGSALEQLEPPEVDGLISQRLSEELRSYDGIGHRRMFSLPKYLREGLRAEQRLVTDDNPVFMV